MCALFLKINDVCTCLRSSAVKPYGGCSGTWHMVQSQCIYTGEREGIGMDFIEKEEELLEKLKETGYSSFGGDKEEALDFVEEQLVKILHFSGDVASKRIRSRLGQGGTGEAVPADSAASGLDPLNRLCAELGLEPFTCIDTGDSEAVSGFIGQSVREIYRRGTGGQQR